jgi:hypothetical protein
VLLACFSAGIATAQVDEDEFSAVSVRYQIREPLGLKGIPREESVDVYVEYSLLPMISVKGGVELAQYELPPLGAATDPGSVDEIVLSASVRYYKAKGRIRFFGSFGIGVFLEERQVGLLEEIHDADLGLLLSGGVEWTIGRNFGFELEAGLQSSPGGEPDSVFVVSVGPKFFF